MPTPSGRPSMMDAIMAGEKIRMHCGNREAGYENPVRSVLNGQHFTSRHQYEDHLKANNCFIVGNDTPKERTEIRGDFDCKSEVASAVKSVLKK
jgi:hypothetical protein